MVHGDFHPGNLLFRNGTVKAILDYDYVRYEKPLYDLGYAAAIFCTNEQTYNVFYKAYLQEFESANSSLAPDIARQIEDGETMNSYVGIACYQVIHWLLGKYLDSPEQRESSRRALQRFLSTYAN